MAFLKVHKAYYGRVEDEFFADKEKFGTVIEVLYWMIYAEDFKSILQTLAEGGSYGADYCGIFLSSSWDEEGDEEDEDYFEDGVMFHMCKEKIIIDYPMFVKCMQFACRIYMEDFGEDEEIKKNLHIIEERYADK